MILIKNGQILPMEGKDLPKGDILIEGGKIKKIAATIEEKDIKVPATDTLQIIDATGTVITPGLIDAHCHLGMWEDAIGFEGDDGNECTDPVTPELRAIDAINPMDRNFQEAYEGGITTVATGPGSANVIGGQFAVIKTFGKRIDDMIVKFPVAMKCAFGENPKRVYSEQHKAPTTRMATASILREVLYEAKEYMEAKKSKDKDKQPDFDLQMEALLPVLKKEIPLKAHAHRADDMFTALRIAKEFGIKITLDHCTEGHLIVEELKAENVPLIVGPSLSERSKFELKNLTFETPGILSKAGIDIAIMTDSPVIPLQYLPMCAALAAKAGMDKKEAMKAITINPAKILGVEKRVGSIKEGKDADIVIWTKHPFDLESVVKYTIIDGKVVHGE